MTGSALPPLTGSTARPLQPDDPRSLGAYQVIGRLGQGGMGTVFLGRAPDGSAVAIKVIRPELAQRAEFRARFAREAESARRVRRFTTAAVLDADPHGQQPYLVTEFVEGPTLSRHVSIRGPLRPADLEQLAVSTTTALSAIHAAGIVHRDLTPGNVLLSPVGPKVIDFGLAREFNADTELSRNVRQAIGTPGYMSPEQILDAPITSAVDIFSWGAVMIFAATGQPPFGTGRMEAILYRIINEPPKLDSLNPELRELVEAAMAKDPAARPSAEELRSALIAGGPVPVHPLGPPGEPATTPGSAGDPAAEPEPARRRWGRRGRADAPTGASTPPVTPVPLAGPADSADSASPATPVATESSAAWAAQSSAMPQTQLSPPPIASPPPVAPPPPLRQGPSAHGSPPPIGPTAPAGSAHPTGSSPAIGSPAPGSSPVPGGAYPPAGAPVGSSPAGGPSTSAGAPPVDPEPASPPGRRRRARQFGGGVRVVVAVAVGVPGLF
ncbi:serine/threonine-protein kinase, partial [Frankia sp. R82]|uniref:serine/threonine-protein kinase n=1 Tax=Frankia sp. R82 TaxID=2950553 RepID=UPI002043A704